MNNKVLYTLEYDKIVRLLQEHLASEIGYEISQALRPASSFEQASALLKQTLEADAVYRRTGKTPIEGFPDTRNSLRRTHAALALHAGELLAIAQCLRASRSARDVLQNGDADGLLCIMANQLSSHRSIEEEIARCILSEDEISDNASVELSRIRRQMRITNERVREKLNNMLKSPAIQKYLQEPIITVRNGRYALPVKAEYRTQVPGLIHDQSGSGATIFIEPTAVVELGNDYKRLLLEEKKEIERVLAGLTALIDPYADELYGSLTVLGTLDVIFAKAVMARDMHANCPNLNHMHTINIKRGRHPLLDREKVVPVDVWLGDTYSTLIITGPNTGGKTVTLKTVGLFTLMAMSGMFIPADEGSNLSVFTEVFADIGDEQSIEQSLSTFSSHMMNNVEILKQANEDSLVLLDELGAGTDPVEGSALAQAILETLFEKRALTVATTHYSEIKAFALTHEGMQNASMEFDVDKLCPTYRLFIGIPGKSNAFEISKRLGLDETVIEKARKFIEHQDLAFEDVISSAENARRAAETERAEAQTMVSEAEKIKNALKVERQKLEDERSVLRQKAKEDARRLVQETRREMEQLIAQLRTLKDIDQKTLERAIQKSRDGMRKEEEKFNESIRRADEGGCAPKALEAGDRVYVLSLGQEASVLKKSDAKGDVAVQAGIIKLTVPITDLRLVKAPTSVKKSSAKIQISQERSGMELDLRGKMVDEATIEIDRFIDDAMISGIKEFSVIHGKGTGALRTGVQAYLRQHPRVKSFRIGAYGEGDAGVTVVTLK